MTVQIGKATDLRANSLSFPEVLAQAIGNIAPVAMPALNVPLVYATAGNATWFTYVIATTGLVLVGLNINHFARQSAYPGSLYGSIARTLGPTPGILAGWSLILAYSFTAMAVLCGFQIYGSVVLSSFGLSVPPILMFAVCGIVCWYYAYTDIQLSTLLMLILETVSVSLVFILCMFVWQGRGFEIDTAQLFMKDASWSGTQSGLVLAVFSYVGFESATVLGREAKNPRRSIPRAVIGSIVLVGLLFIFFSYIEVLGFKGVNESLSKSSEPLNFLAEQAGVGLLGLAISVGIMFSFFTCALASVNAGSRIAYSLARNGVFHASIGRAHQHNETPHVAVTLTAILVFLVPASVSLFGIPILDIYSYTGTLATYGFLLVYVLISIAAPIELRRQNKLRQHHLITSVVAVVFMLIPIFGSVYPVPAFPFNVLPYLFLLYLGLGVWLFSMVRRRSPEVEQRLTHSSNPHQNPLD